MNVLGKSLFFAILLLAVTTSTSTKTCTCSDCIKAWKKSCDAGTKEAFSLRKCRSLKVCQKLDCAVLKKWANKGKTARNSCVRAGHCKEAVSKNKPCTCSDCLLLWDQSYDGGYKNGGIRPAKCRSLNVCHNPDCGALNKWAQKGKNARDSCIKAGHCKPKAGMGSKGSMNGMLGKGPCVGKGTKGGMAGKRKGKMNAMAGKGKRNIIKGKGSNGGNGCDDWGKGKGCKMSKSKKGKKW